jgi:hypothetical protein
MNRSNFQRAGLLIALAFLLVGCMGDVNVTVDFYRGGNWEAVTELSVPQEAAAMAGGAGQIEAELDDLVREAAQENVRTSWEEGKDETNLVYIVDMEGKELDSLSRTALEGAEITVQEENGERVIHLSYYPGGLGFESQTLVLRGGEIIAGNGRMMDDRTMMWENPSSEVRVTLKERSRFSVGRALGIAGAGLVGAGLLVGVVYVWRRNRTKAPTYCPWCGAENPRDADFCTQCGRSLVG